MTINRDKTTEPESKDPLSRLAAKLKIGDISHAFILSGGSKEIRESAARKFSKEVFKDDSLASYKIDHELYEDLIYVRKETSSIVVKQIEELNARMSNRPYFADRTMAIIADGDDMTPESQNKLLKTLEEPAPGNIIVLLCANPESLFLTIRSRCVLIRLGSEVAEFDGAYYQDAKNIISKSMFSRETTHEIFNLLDDYTADKAEAIALLDNMELFLRDLAVGGYVSDLVYNEENRPIAERMSGRDDRQLLRYIALIEETRNDIQGHYKMNSKTRMRNMILHFRHTNTGGAQ